MESKLSAKELKKQLRLGNFIQIDSLTDGSEHIEQCNLFHLQEMGTTLKYQYSPIPLTEEWLERFGFEKDEVLGWTLNGLVVDYPTVHFSFDLWRDKKENVVYLDFTEIPQYIDHVHQLQNLYFALTGEELTIKK